MNQLDDLIITSAMKWMVMIRSFEERADANQHVPQRRAVDLKRESKARKGDG
jgi:hypothetical protein